MEAAALTGGCLCGDVRFELTDEPLSALYCHCTRCQRRTGTGASASAILPSASFRIVSGERLVRSYQAQDGYATEFCSACGSDLWSRHPKTGEVRAVRMGAFDRDPGVRPSVRQFTADAAAWEPIPDDGLRRFPGPIGRR